MIPVPAGVRVRLATGHTDMRKGVVTLPCSEREVSAPQELSGRCDCCAPRVHRRGAKGAVRLGRREMALDVKGVVDSGVHGEKFLRRTRTLEPLHLALPPPRRLMRILSPIVLCALARRIVLPGGNPGRQTLAPAGSDRSESGGDE